MSRENHKNTESIWMKKFRYTGKKIAALVLVGFVLFGILDRSGAFQREISRTVTVGIYQDGEQVGETTVTIDGSLYWLGSGASGVPSPWRRRRRPARRGPTAASPGVGRRRKVTRRSTGAEPALLG